MTAEPYYTDAMLRGLLDDDYRLRTDSRTMETWFALRADWAESGRPRAHPYYTLLEFTKQAEPLPFDTPLLRFEL